MDPLLKQMMGWWADRLSPKQLRIYESYIKQNNIRVICNQIIKVKLFDNKLIVTA
jgi:hypothetical protein